MHAIARLDPIVTPASDLAAPDMAALLDQATASAGIGAWACDLSDDRLTWSSGVFDLFGLPRNRVVDRRETLALYDEPSRAALERLRPRAILTGEGFSMEARIVRADRSVRWMRMTVEAERRHGRTLRLYGIKQDITAERMRWDELRRRAESDALTGLAGRATFQRDFLDSSEGCVGALVLLDLDEFKLVNDRHGHAAGDACLRAIAERMASALPGATMTARIGGDEFAILLPPGMARGVAWAALNRLIAACARPIVHDGRAFAVRVSAGIAFSHGGESPEALFAAADAALYAAKRAGRGCARVAPGR